MITSKVHSLVRNKKQLEYYARVRCNNRYHFLAIINGRLVPLNHNYHRELALIDLGGEVCPCMKIMSDWKYYSDWHLPPKLKPYHNDQRSLNMYRRVRRQLYSSSLAGNSDWYTYPPVVAKLCAMVYKRMRLSLLYRCNYFCLKQLPWCLRCYSTEESSLYGEPTCMASRHKVELKFPFNNLLSEEYISIVVHLDPKNWLCRAWARGWAVIEGRLVIHVSDPDPTRLIRDGYKALILDEVRGVKGSTHGDIMMISRLAEVAQTPGEKPHIVRWYDESSPSHIGAAP